VECSLANILEMGYYSVMWKVLLYPALVSFLILIELSAHSYILGLSRALLRD